MRVTTISHRPATRSDLEQIVEIYNSTIPSRMVTADAEPVSVESRVPWFEEHRPDIRPLWVVEGERRILAWLSFSSFYGRPAYAKTAEVAQGCVAGRDRTGSRHCRAARMRRPTSGCCGPTRGWLPVVDTTQTARRTPGR